MPEWVLQLIGPIVSGAMSGLMIVAGLRVEVRNLRESTRRAHVRIDDHINQHLKT